MKKAILISVLILFALAAFAGYYIYQFKDKIETSYVIKKFELRELFVGKIGIILDLKIKNTSSSSITLKNVYIEVFYKGVLVSRTENAIPRVDIVPNGTSLTPAINIAFMQNAQSAEIISLYMSKKPIDLEISLKTSVLSIPIRIKTNYTYTQ